MTGYSEVTNAVAAMASIQSCKRKKTKIVYNASNIVSPFRKASIQTFGQFDEPFGKFQTTKFV